MRNINYDVLRNRFFIFYYDTANCQLKTANLKFRLNKIPQIPIQVRKNANFAEILD
jgi:hypothetical protein